MAYFRNLLLAAFAIPALAASPPTVADAQAFMDRTETELLKLGSIDQRAGWVHENFITDDTEILAANQDEKVISRVTELIEESKQFEALDLPSELRRKILLLKLSLVMPAPKSPRLREELTQIATSLNGMYGKGKYCPGGAHEPCFGIEELEERLAKSRDPKQIRDMWTGWHQVGAPMRDRYARFVELSNQGARELGFADTGVLWRSGYDMTPEQFSADLERLWKQVEPLYRELHAYVRAKLVEKYGAIAARPDGMIPANLLGNMWAQQWGNIYDLVAPAAAPPTYDVGAILTNRKTTPKQLVMYGENFFRSLGLQKLPDTFWDRSLFSRPADRDVVCHASSWDIDFNLDVRLKVCLHDTSDDFVTVHHELGHTYYFLAYRNQPFLFRAGANDGFHEAIGDTIALSITPEYLKKIGLIDHIPSPAADLPLLLRTALDKIAFLPFGLMIDKWRWDVFSGQVPPADYNKYWWTLRERYQGVAPPVNRTEADFDPGAKYHIPSNTPYIRYFLADIYQFQFYRAMCRAAGYTGPLNRCSFYDSKAAGDKLEAMLALGASKPWPEALKALTGEDRADASAMVEYFRPLLAWLEEQNKGVKTGWTVDANPMSTS
ncbi:MAG: M2 family metallopeptidase [Acidobacteriaceae bacterium]|nr:M2 family metallopeptidase [Acidobacteriaceae bacterium]